MVLRHFSIISAVNDLMRASVQLLCAIIEFDIFNIEFVNLTFHSLYQDTFYNTTSLDGDSNVLRYLYICPTQCIRDRVTDPQIRYCL